MKIIGNYSIRELEDGSLVPSSMDEVEAIAELESQTNFKNYWKKGRTDEEVKDHIYTGKKGEGIFILEMLKSNPSSKVNHGIRVGQATPDSGSDVTIDNISYQIKTTRRLPAKSFSICVDPPVSPMKKLTDIMAKNAYIVQVSLASNTINIIDLEKFKRTCQPSKYETSNSVYSYLDNCLTKELRF